MDNAGCTLCCQTPATGRSVWSARPAVLALPGQHFPTVWLRNSCGVGCRSLGCILTVKRRREQCVCAGAGVHWCWLALGSLTEHGCKFHKILIYIVISPELVHLETPHYSYIFIIILCFSSLLLEKGIHTQ